MDTLDNGQCTESIDISIKQCGHAMEFLTFSTLSMQWRYLLVNLKPGVLHAQTTIVKDVLNIAYLA